MNTKHWYATVEAMGREDANPAVIVQGFPEESLDMTVLDLLRQMAKEPVNGDTPYSQEESATAQILGRWLEEHDSKQSTIGAQVLDAMNDSFKIDIAKPVRDYDAYMGEREFMNPATNEMNKYKTIDLLVQRGFPSGYRT